MKTIYVVVILILFSTLNQAQFKTACDKKLSLNQNTWLSLQMSMNKINRYSDSVANPNKTAPQGTINTSLTDTIKYNRYVDKINRYHDPVANPNKTAPQGTINTSLTDTMKYNMYGDLLNENPLYNKKSSLGMVALRVTFANVSTLLIHRYIFNYDFSRVGFNSWSQNIKTGWEWDNDRFA